MNRSKDITGQRFGKLTVVRDVGTSSTRHRMLECLCDCGNTTRVRSSALRTGRIKSCGCPETERVRMLEIPSVELEAIKEWFLRRLDTEDRPMPTCCEGFGPCLNWKGHTDGKNRAAMTIQGHRKRASHVAWYLAFGYWPKFLCHRCDNSRCVELAHLFEGDTAINQYDRMVKRQGGILVA